MKYIPKIKRKIDPNIWKEPKKAWEDMCDIYKEGHEMRVPFGASIQVLCSPDPRNIVKVFLRSGRILEKDEKFVDLRAYQQWLRGTPPERI
jgi:hypothetical protein